MPPCISTRSRSGIYRVWICSSWPPRTWKNWECIRLDTRSSYWRLWKNSALWWGRKRNHACMCTVCVSTAVCIQEAVCCVCVCVDINWAVVFLSCCVLCMFWHSSRDLYFSRHHTGFRACSCLQSWSPARVHNCSYYHTCPFSLKCTQSLEFIFFSLSSLLQFCPPLLYENPP